MYIQIYNTDRNPKLQTSLSSSSLKQRQEPSVVQRSSVPELVRNRRLPLGENVLSSR